jgi:cellobiose transport system permease protein
MTNATVPAMNGNRFVNAIKYIYKNRSAYLFISPFFIGFAIFGLYPMLYSVYLSFNTFKFRAPIVWVGLENYKDILTDHNFLVSITNTLILWGGTLPVQIILAFFIASIINTFIKKRMKGVFSGLFYLPEVTNLVAVALVFQLIFDNKFGISNYLLSLVGLPTIPWLLSEPWARFSTILLIIWRGTGWYIVFILAALQNINKEYYEVGLVEGANILQRAWYITIPMLKPIILYLIVMGTIAGWQIFTEPYLLMRGVSKVLGGPGQAVLTPSMLVYEKAFVSLKFGYASAVSTMVGLVISLFSVLYFRVFREK